jgi:hypothetical protein
MHLGKLLHKSFPHSFINLDKRIHKTLLSSVETLCECRHLSIAGLGRSFRTHVAVKHVIKKIDRLFGNQQLHKKRKSYYRIMAKLLINANTRPVILIDWSGLTRCGEYHFLRASIPVGGRALVVWECTYRESEYTKPGVHREFIQTLSEILPPGCKPIIITDAGFRGTWFQMIQQQQGWDFIGRVRNRTQCQKTGEKKWFPIKNYYGAATAKAKYLFTGLLAKANPTIGHFYLIRGDLKNRKRKNLRGKKIQCSVSLKHAKREREPWLIFTSLPIDNYQAKQVIQLYKTRMQIEEAFRDLKNTRNGFSLRHCRSFNRERLNVALLIAAIAMLLLWILGTIEKNAGKHYLYQANTVRHRSVLSTFTIGWQSLKRRKSYSLSEFYDALAIIKIAAEVEGQ